MAKIARRRFLKQTSIGVATVGVGAGVLAAAPRLAAMAAPPAVSTVNSSLASVSEPVMVYVSNAATGELHIMAGLKEIVVRDTELVTRLLASVK
ncbi:MAG: hypothetical protein M3Z24_00480 [Chloroflexota bacterium]|nr:hypothetical protein [Chloroflexota bacterium]